MRTHGALISPIVALAPMAGITDWPMRLLCRERGCSRATTEMVSATGFITAPKALHVYTYLLATHPDEGRPAVQLFGHEPRAMALAAARLTELDRFSGIDINMGCPAQKVTASGSGSALMKDLPLCANILSSVRAATPLPLTVKMRLGWDAQSVNAPALAHIAQECGADGLTVHGRTRAQQYAGRADWAQIARVKQSVSIPVLLNGDIFCARDALDALAQTGCDGVAIGRGALGNPFLFTQIAQALAGEEPAPVTLSDTVETAIRQAEMMRAWKGERSAVLEMRKHFCWYIRGRRHSARLRARVNACDTLDDVYALLRAYREDADAREQSE